MGKTMKVMSVFFVAFFLLFGSLSSVFAEADNTVFEPLAKGATGDRVTELQQKLQELGYTVADEEGQFGIGTKNALFMYQNDHGIDPTGILDEETYLSLYPPEKSELDDVEVGSNYHDDPCPGEIVTAKSRLWLLGYDCGNTTKEADDAFVAVIKQFQKDHGIEETGICNHETREAIKADVDDIHFYPVLGKNEEGNIRLGMINKAGQLIIQPQYTNFEVNEGIAILELRDRNRVFPDIYDVTSVVYYVTGEQVGFPEQSSIGDIRYSDGVILIYNRETQLYSLCNAKGEVISPNHWGAIPYFTKSMEDGLVKVCDSKNTREAKWGLIDATGEFVVPPVYEEDNLEAVGNGWYIEKTEEGMFLRNVYNKDISHIITSYLNNHPFIDGILLVRKDGANLGINEKGNIVDTNYEEGYVCGLKRERERVISGNIGYKNKAGEVVIPFQYGENSGDFMKEGFASVQRRSVGYCLIDTQGNNPFPDIWSLRPIQFSCGLARIVQDGKVGYINTKGQMVIPMMWDYSELERKCDANSFEASEISDFAFITMYKHTKQFEGGLALVVSGDSFYYIDTEGEIIAYAGPSSMADLSSKPYRRSEESCKSIAKEYLKNHLKNPNSLQVHSISSRAGDGGYVVTIEYSGMNSFGGYTRGIFICTVDPLQGIVTDVIYN